jgi:hypothetical protein
VRLLLDEHLSPQISVLLRARGHDAIAVAERADLRALGDPLLLAAATRERRAIATRDFGGFRGPVQDALGRGARSFGLVLIPRHRSSSTAAIARALDRLLIELPGDDDLVRLRGGEIWLPP